MPAPISAGITHIKEQKLKAVVGGTCEVCRERCTVEELELHFVPLERGEGPDITEDLQHAILVVCSLCHRHIHGMPVAAAQQRVWVSRRPYIVRELMRDILGYVRLPYEPPDQPLSDL